jgi:drug/metabolite transporter (DMT)-like permease
MTGLALALVLASAVTHAIWNYFAKRADGGGIALVWLFSTLAVFIYLPLAISIWVNEHRSLGLVELAAIGGTCLLHIAYYFLLQRGYQAGDLSLVYPIARGSGPILASLGAVLLLNERPTPLVIMGTGLVTLSVFALTGNPISAFRSDSARAIGYGLLIGLIIAAYTLWDKRAVSDLLIPPLFLTWASNIFRAAALAPYALRHRGSVGAVWRNHRRETIGIGILDSLSYILFLIALQFSDVSVLSPLRQTSILIGAFLGLRLLSEEAGRRRLIAASVILTGVLALAFG